MSDDELAHAIDGLLVAHDGLMEMIGYVDDYFVDKWDLTAYIMNTRAVLTELGVGPDVWS